jgi:hypothetical protein
MASGDSPEVGTWTVSESLILPRLMDTWVRRHGAVVHTRQDSGNRELLEGVPTLGQLERRLLRHLQKTP